jgi:hypothetical protein
LAVFFAACSGAAAVSDSVVAILFFLQVAQRAD